MMVPDPDMVQYACIAEGTIALAEFNSRDESLGSIAAKCLKKTAPFHSTFSHTTRAQTYTFLIDDPFAYFAIFNENMESFERFAFLKSVKEAFVAISNGDLGRRKLDRLASHCFQREFNPVFHQLVGPGLPSPGSPVGQRLVEKGGVHQNSDHLRGRLNGDPAKGLKKKNLREKFKMGGRGWKGRSYGEKKDDADDGGEGMGLTREYSPVIHRNGFYSGELNLMGHHKASKVWKKLVLVVLWLDLFACSLLFIVWLCVCRGFKCIDG